MPSAKRVLVVIDPTSEEQPALKRATWLAARLGVGLDLHVCVYDQRVGGSRLFDTDAQTRARRALLKEHRERLEQLAQPLRDQGLNVNVDTAWDRSLHEGILRRIEKSKPRFVLKDTHYHPVIRRTIFSNSDWNLIQKSPAALWLVKPHADSAVRTVIAAVDPLHERDKPARLDHKILKTAKELASAGAARLDVVHAFDAAPIFAAATETMMSFPIAEPMAETIAALRAQHQKAMQKLTARHNIPVGNAHMIEGEAREVLVGACTEYRADLMVIGAVARGALRRLALGSTAERVLDFIPCDLLVVKPDRARS